jgi:hypothetical protein
MYTCCCRDRRFAWLQLRGAVEQGLAAELDGDGGGLVGGGRGGLRLAAAAQLPGVVQQAVGQVIRSAQLPLAGDRGRESGPVVASAAGPGQVAFGAQHGRQPSGLESVEHGEQLFGGRGVIQLPGRASPRG